MSVNFSSGNYSFPQMDPDSYAKDYAKQNGISLSEAQELLKTQFGDPEQQGITDNTSIFDQTGTDYDTYEFGDMSDTDPNAFAQLYADANNMSLEEAIEALEDLYGEPEEPEDVSSSYSQDYTASTSSFSIPSQIDPDTYAQQYANENGITLDEAKEILESKYGAPEDREDSSSNNTFEYSHSTSSSSIPPQIDPDTYAQQYADENGITLDEAKEILASMYGDPEEQ